jgi:hypothetical protein
VPYLNGTSSAALCKATDVTMQNVKKVIMERYYLDTLGYFPKNTKDTVANHNLKYLFTQPAGWGAFDPATQTGWRQGGYLQNGITLNADPDPSFQDDIDTDGTPIYVHDKVIANQIQVLDGWGRPIILQNTVNGFRLVSAGTNASIDTGISENRKEDDRVLYLDKSTPANNDNPSCDE